MEKGLYRIEGTGIVLFLTVGLYFLMWFQQKAAIRYNSNDPYIPANSILGVICGVGRNSIIYVRPMISQLIAVTYVIFGTGAVWGWGQDGFVFASTIMVIVWLISLSTFTFWNWINRRSR